MVSADNFRYSALSTPWTVDHVQHLLTRFESLFNLILPILSKQLATTSLYPVFGRPLVHKFVVFDTQGSHWSLEKVRNALIFQRSYQAASVINACLVDQLRTPVKQVLTDSANDTLQEFVHFLFNKKELMREYHVRNDNCQLFATRVYDHFAKSSHAVDKKTTTAIQRKD